MLKPEHRHLKPLSSKLELLLESEAQVLADSTQIYQILKNLCVNASHAMNDGNGSIRVSARDIASANGSDKEEKQVLLSVSDDGKGILEENIEKIFDPFFTTNAPRAGHGLGNPQDSRKALRP